MRCAIFDLDGLLADCSQRVHFLNFTPPDWDSFYQACSGDTPIHASIDIYNALMDSGFHIAIVTGRVEEVRGKTISWLERHFIPKPHSLLMRPDGDQCKDTILKEYHVGQLRKDGITPVMAFDDREGCVDLYWSLGIVCYHLNSDRISKSVDSAELYSRSVDGE